jgi:hypothetical protein
MLMLEFMYVTSEATRALYVSPDVSIIYSHNLWATAEAVAKATRSERTPLPRDNIRKLIELHLSSLCESKLVLMIERFK